MRVLGTLCKDAIVPEAERFMTAREVAEVLQVDRHDLYHLVRLGALPAARIGEKRLRFRRADIEALVKREGVCA